jgi:nucleotide-binding universal stress UspA family protein
MATTTSKHDLVHNDEHHEQITRIVCVALDTSHHSQHALEWAIKNILSPASDLVVLLNTRPVAVVPGPYGSAYMDFSNYIVQLEEQNRNASHALLKRGASLLKTAGFTVKAFSLRGDPREELTRKVSELNADMLVMGSRGMSTLKRMFIGSVSDHLIHHCACPVVLVKDKEEAEENVPENASIAEPVPASMH